VILIRMGFDEDLLMRIDGQPDPPTRRLDDDLAANPPNVQANEIVRRISLRTELGLPRRDCGARLQRERCPCLGRALDQLIGVQGVNREWVVSLSRQLHKETLATARERKRAEKAQRKEANRRVKEAREASKSSSASARPHAKTVSELKSSAPALRQPPTRSFASRPLSNPWS